ncbi:hypothetical protein Tco_0415585 [Tanacetum coccineum]
MSTQDLALPETKPPTCMTLELADRSITEPIGIAKDVRLMVGKFQFPADFVVVDFEPDPREGITIQPWTQTFKIHKLINHMTVNKIDVIDMACDEYSQEVLGFSNVIASGNPTPYFEPIVSTASPTLTPFGDSDFLLFEEADSFLALEDDPTSSEVDPNYQDPEGDILLLEAILNSEPPPPLPNQEQYLPGVRKELKLCEANTVEPSVDEPPEVELKELPPHLEYAFLEGDDKLPVIIAKDLKDEEKAALLKVLKSHKRAIAWKLSDIKGVNPEFCTHKILMEEDYEPSVQSQRRVNPKIHDVIKKEVEKLLDAGLIYPISDSPWVSPVHCVPKKGGMTVITNDENELIPTRLVTGWRKSIFTVKEGIVLGHKISKSGIEVDRAKVEVIAKLPHPTTVKVTKYLLCQKELRQDSSGGSYATNNYIEIRDKKEQPKSRRHHLSRLGKPHQDKTDTQKSTEACSSRNSGYMLLLQESKSSEQVDKTVVFRGEKLLDILKIATSGPTGRTTKERLCNVMNATTTPSKFAIIFDIWGIDLWAVPVSEGTSIILVAVDYCVKMG